MLYFYVTCKREMDSISSVGTCGRTPQSRFTLVYVKRANSSGKGDFRWLGRSTRAAIPVTSYHTRRHTPHSVKARQAFGNLHKSNMAYLKLPILEDIILCGVARRLCAAPLSSLSPLGLRNWLPSN
jgi:hypothetical protein